MSGRHWQPAAGQAFPTSIGNWLMDRHALQSLVTIKWTGLPEDQQMDRHVMQVLAIRKWTGMSGRHWQPADGQAFPSSIGNW